MKRHIDLLRLVILGRDTSDYQPDQVRYHQGLASGLAPDERARIVDQIADDARWAWAREKMAQAGAPEIWALAVDLAAPSSSRC